MQLVRTSLNLRSNVPWSILYKECIYAWLDGSKNKRTGEKNYAAILRKLPRSIDFQKNPHGRYEFAGQILEYDSFMWEGCEHLGFSFINIDREKKWKTQIALKRTDKFVLCYVSLDCDLGKTKAGVLPEIKKPRIIDYLLKQQDGDGVINIQGEPHFIEPSEVDKAKNVLSGKMRNILPIIYLSCSKKTHSLLPSHVAKKLLGIAHVYAERDSSLRERLALAMKGKRFPKGGEIGICHVGEPIHIFNRHSVVEWADDPEILVQDIYLHILKKNLSLKLNFTWDDFLKSLSDFRKDVAEKETIQKLESLDAMKKELAAAKESSKAKSLVTERLMAELEAVTKERDQYKNEHTLYESLKKEYDSCSDDRKTWETLANEFDEQLRQANDELQKVKAELHERNLENESLKHNLDSKKDKNVRYIPLKMPAEPEMYSNEIICQMLFALRLAKDNVPPTTISPRIRTLFVIDEILKDNPEAVSIYEDYCKKKKDLEIVAKNAALKTAEGGKVMKPFNMELVPKGNNHGKIRFKNDVQERFLGSEASSGSDKARGRGGKNEASDLTKAMLW